MFVSNRYSNRIAKFIDVVCYILMRPCLIAFNNFFASYISTIHEKFGKQKIKDCLVFGPLFAVIFILTLPVAFIGAILWIILCEIRAWKQDRFTFVCLENNSHEYLRKKYTVVECSQHNIYSVCTANVLLASEFLGKLNNINDSTRRSVQIAKKILDHSGKPVLNTIAYEHAKDTTWTIESKLASVISQFPYIDFLCLQEVWERCHAMTLIKYLQADFKYFIYDVGEYSWETNFCMYGSGLMFASKKPVLNAEFKPFTMRRKHARFSSQGALCVKVLLHYDLAGRRYVGYLCNLHTQAYQGEEAVIDKQLSEVSAFISEFRFATTRECEQVCFDIVCGDFNADNMSPGDEDVRESILFAEYQDFCSQKPGSDYKWTIGTELRHVAMGDECVRDPESFRRVLVDDVVRRWYVIDADILVHRADQVIHTPALGVNGQPEVCPHGGKRRVDRILSRKFYAVEVLGYAFVSALGGLTDHLPVCLTFRPWPGRPS
ncbi:sphingomyelin phosphodiesterase 5-like [Bacillus rossius redtenbacheri]|uniref:sphingomyelin phosphodiesterase 5-like n=1 Tax=Bacillus rossius redtenbacheri TaxID=93214 RepID=UPI002FDE6BED